MYEIQNGRRKSKGRKQEKYVSHYIYQQGEFNLMLCVGLKRRFPKLETERESECE